MCDKVQREIRAMTIIKKKVYFKLIFRETEIYFLFFSLYTRTAKSITISYSQGLQLYTASTASECNIVSVAKQTREIDTTISMKKKIIWTIQITNGYCGMFRSTFSPRFWFFLLKNSAVILHLLLWCTIFWLIYEREMR